MFLFGSRGGGGYSAPSLDFGVDPVGYLNYGQSENKHCIGVIAFNIQGGMEARFTSLNLLSYSFFSICYVVLLSPRKYSSLLLPIFRLVVATGTRPLQRFERP